MKAIKYDNVLHYEYVSIRKGDLINAGVSEDPNNCSFHSLVTL